MLFKLHYFLTSAGSNALLIFLGVHLSEYTGASPAELGLIYMVLPFVSVLCKPIICSLADRHRAHRKVLILCHLFVALSFLPFVIIPFLGRNIYEARARFCWYILVAFNILGDVAVGGVHAIGDSLTVNYAKRIGTEFGAYQVWGIVSWMIFGLVTGQLNEIWFLPKYVAGFMVLVLVSLLAALTCFVWPKEYFVMIPASSKLHHHQQVVKDQKQSWLRSQRKSLMPKELVWAHVKRQLYSLVTSSQRPESVSSAEQNTKSLAGAEQKSMENDTDSLISTKTQLQTLLLLMRSDKRVIFYMIAMIGAGATMMPTSFFIISLSKRCQTENTCNFSQLAGYLQIAIAILDPILFLHIETIIKHLGRLNTLTIAFALGFFKFLFYATIWPHVNPHWSLVSELVDGVLFVVFITIQFEVGHLFASEVGQLMPELIKRAVIDANESRERLELSLPATILALFSCAGEGLGKGFGALAYGLIIEAYSYETLWVIISMGAFCVVVIIQSIAMFERCCHVKFALDHLDPAGELQKTRQLDLGLRNAGNKLAEMEHDPQSDGAETSVV